MKNGKYISVDDMDLNHLRNVLKMIIRNNNQKVQVQAFHDKIMDVLEVGMTDLETGIL